jgi:H/ACA ribonucleoprotein complex subunit 3
MSREILFCKNCDSFTLKSECSKCNKKTVSPKPGKYSPLDPYGKYRRIAKQNDNTI